MRFSALIPVLLAGAETLKDQLPGLGEYLAGWKMVAAAVCISVVVAALRIRTIVDAFDAKTDDKKGGGDA